MDTVLVDTHRNGVIELGFDTYHHSKFMKKRRREFAKTDEFRTVPIENTDDEWWRDKYKKERKNPSGRKQLMVQYIYDKQDGLNPTKPHLWAGFHIYEDTYFSKLKKGWKTDKKAKRQWMQNNTLFGSIKKLALLAMESNDIIDSIIDEILREDADVVFETPTFELIYKEEIEEELNGIS